METLEKYFPVILIIVSIVLTILMGYTATNRPLTGGEVAVIETLSLLAAFVGSYVSGRRISKDKINEIIEPYARSAFRRLISLFRSLSRVAEITESDKYDDSLKVNIINAIVIEQIATASDALADWEDIVPESVKELKKGMNLDNMKGERYD